MTIFATIASLSGYKIDLAMTILNVSLPESMQGFVNEQVAKGGYNSASEYIQHLLVQELERLAKVRLETLLLEGLDSGKPIEITDEWWEEKRTELVEKFSKRS